MPSSSRDHARGRRLAVRSGEVHRRILELRRPEVREQRVDAFAGRRGRAGVDAGTPTPVSRLTWRSSQARASWSRSSVTVASVAVGGGSKPTLSSGVIDRGDRAPTASVGSRPSLRSPSAQPTRPHPESNVDSRRRCGAFVSTSMFAFVVALLFGSGAAAAATTPHGSAARMVLNRAIVDIAATPSGNGYWLVATDGGIFAFGDAALRRLDRLHPSQPTDRRHRRHADGQRLLARRIRRRHLRASVTPASSAPPARCASTDPIVGIAATPTGNGYWLAASDGGIFAFGDARFFGSTGAMRLNRPIVGIAATPERQRLLARRIRRRHLRVRRRRLRRLHRRHAPHVADHRHRERAPRRVLARRRRRRRLRVRRRAVPRLGERGSAATRRRPRRDADRWLLARDELRRGAHRRRERRVRHRPRPRRQQPGIDDRVRARRPVERGAARAWARAIGVELDPGRHRHGVGTSNSAPPTRSIIRTSSGCCASPPFAGRFGYLAENIYWGTYSAADAGSAHAGLDAVGEPPRGDAHARAAVRRRRRRLHRSEQARRRRGFRDLDQCAAAAGTRRLRRSHPSSPRTKPARTADPVPGGRSYAAPPVGPALQLTDISLELDGTTVLAGIDWTVARGERWVDPRCERCRQDHAAPSRRALPASRRAAPSTCSASAWGAATSARCASASRSPPRRSRPRSSRA